MIASYVGGPFDGTSDEISAADRPVTRRAATWMTMAGSEVSVWASLDRLPVPGVSEVLTTYRKVYEGTLPDGEMVVVYVAQKP